MEIPPVLVINLQERTDRWSDIQQAFRSWPFKLERVNAIKEKPVVHACWKSHQRCIQIAKSRNYPWVLILEDDCLPVPDGKDRYLALLPTLWNTRSKWDMFNGGAEMYSQEWITKLIQDSPPIFLVRPHMTHFILVHKDTYDRLLNTIPNGAIDTHYRYTYQVWCTNPHIAIQKPGKSDLGNRDDTLELMKRSEDQMTRFQANVPHAQVKLTTLAVCILCILGAMYFQHKKRT